MTHEHSGGRRPLSGDRGSVTIEAALGIASIVTVLLLVLAGVGACLTQFRLEAVAREAARVAAIEGIDSGCGAGQRDVPTGAELECASEGDMVVVEARFASTGIPGVGLVARAAVRAEPGSASGSGS